MSKNLITGRLDKGLYTADNWGYLYTLEEDDRDVFGNSTILFEKSGKSWNVNFSYYKSGNEVVKHLTFRTKTEAMDVIENYSLRDIKSLDEYVREVK